MRKINRRGAGQKNYGCLLAAGALFLVGCQTIPSAQDKKNTAKESTQEVVTALGTVADVITGRETQTRYCPVCGRHYSGHLARCPKDNSPLKDIEE